jgi:outer membrane immunogenic protein
MSRRSILGASLVALAFGTGAAGAADIYAPPPPPAAIYNPAPAFSWTGGYVGGILGYGWGTPKVGGTTWSADGVTGGVFGGYNFQPSSNFVLGLETDITASGMSGKKAGVTVDNNWNGTIRGRAGFAFDRFMAYGTGGVALGNIQTKIPGSKDTSLRTGYTVGGGLEAALTNSVVGRVEYRYTSFGAYKYATTPKTKASFSSNEVLVGLGVKF